MRLRTRLLAGSMLLDPLGQLSSAPVHLDRYFFVGPGMFGPDDQGKKVFNHLEAFQRHRRRLAVPGDDRAVVTQARNFTLGDRSG